MNHAEFLKAVPLFSGLGEEDLAIVSSKAEVIEFVRDAHICKEGEAADSMFIIKSGIVQIHCDDGAGGKKILTHLKLGEYFGEMAILTDEPRNASATALAETEVIRLRKEDFHGLLSTVPKVSLGIIRTLCGRLSKANIGSGQGKSFNVYAVMGPDTGSGKSFFSRNLAWAMQDILGKEVLLYDPNLRDDRVARLLGIAEHSKIIDELIDRERIAHLQKYVVKAPCGLLTIEPQENGLTDVRLKEFHTFSLMKTVMESFEFIVVDSSSMFTKVTKEIVQSCDKIVYLISSKNVSVCGLIQHFEETRRTWKVDPSKVVYGVNHMSDDPSQESLITEKDKEIISFELPYVKELAGRREPDTEVLLQRDPEHPISKKIYALAEDILFDQILGLYLPAFADDPSKAELAKRWAETGCQELSSSLRNMDLKGPITLDGQEQFVLEGHTAKWLLNKNMVTLVDFANKFKQQFGLNKVILTINGQESVV